MCIFATVNFDELNLQPQLAEGLEYMGFQKLTPIQEQAIPLILQDRDLIACAQTGTGKTAAFLLPVLNKLTAEPSEFTDTLIIVPTRELAIQIDESLQGFGYFTPVSSLAIFGGNDGVAFEQEKRALTQGANVIIATPGRLIAHLNMGYVKMDKLKHLILDEADRMLDMGFADDLAKIIKHLPAERQTLMFSATMPPKIRSLANKILRNPAEINISISKPAAGVTQSAYVVYDKQKAPLLYGILQNTEFSSVIIFCSRKDSVKQLEREMARQKFNVAAIHSDLEQGERNEVLRNFKNRSIRILVATDILSRGIDIDSISLVVNYDVPGDAEDYVHRVGRTARAETTGQAITFINEQDQRRFKRIEDMCGYEINKLPIPAELGPGPEYAPLKKQPKQDRPQGGNRRKPFRGNRFNKK